MVARLLGYRRTRTSWLINALWTFVFLACVGSLLLLASRALRNVPALPTAGEPASAPSEKAAPAIKASDAPAGMVKIRGGEFWMGSDQSSYASERPRHRVRVDSFWIDRHEVTNRQFREFVDETGHLTQAERQGWAPVFDREQKTWVPVDGADWRHPHGPSTDLRGKESHPVVQVSWQDAQAYARWAGKRLPTEAEWEYAARGGLSDAVYPWGNREVPSGKYLANYWQGVFPERDLGLDGFQSTAPVGSFPPNGYGLRDMSGNVWEWCQDWSAEAYYRRSPVDNPTGPHRGTHRIQRGGSWLCAASNCPGYKVHTRIAARPDQMFPHAGFRCARDAD